MTSRDGEQSVEGKRERERKLINGLRFYFNLLLIRDPFLSIVRSLEALSAGQSCTGLFLSSLSTLSKSIAESLISSTSCCIHFVPRLLFSPSNATIERPKIYQINRVDQLKQLNLSKAPSLSLLPLHLPTSADSSPLPSHLPISRTLDRLRHGRVHFDTSHDRNALRTFAFKRKSPRLSKKLLLETFPPIFLLPRWVVVKSL